MSHKNRDRQADLAAVAIAFCDHIEEHGLDQKRPLGGTLSSDIAYAISLPMDDDFGLTDEQESYCHNLWRDLPSFLKIAVMGLQEEVKKTEG